VLGTGVLGTGALETAGALAAGVFDTVARGAAGGVAFWIGRLAIGAAGCVAGCDTSPTDVVTLVAGLADVEPGQGLPCAADVDDGDDPGHGCDCGLLAGAACACGAGLLFPLLCGFWLVGYRGDPTYGSGFGCVFDGAPM